MTKSAEQILDEIAPFAQIEMHHTDYEKIIQAMKIYAEQVVDEYAGMINKDWLQYCKDNGIKGE